MDKVSLTLFFLPTDLAFQNEKKRFLGLQSLSHPRSSVVIRPIAPSLLPRIVSAEGDLQKQNCHTSA